MKKMKMKIECPFSISTFYLNDKWKKSTLMYKLTGVVIPIVLSTLKNNSGYNYFSDFAIFC